MFDFTDVVVVCGTLIPISLFMLASLAKFFFLLMSSVWFEVAWVTCRQVVLELCSGHLEEDKVAELGLPFDFERLVVLHYPFSVIFESC